jgi:predicted DNA-binding transcriptional regulator AlpA
VPTKEVGAAPAAVPFPPSDIITAEELAGRLKCSVHWVYSQMRAGTKNPLPVMRAGRLLRFSWTAVSEWLRGHNLRKKKAA